MQISKRRMQNKQLVRSLAAAQRDENYLRKSQVILFTGAANAAHKLTILHSDF